MTDQQPPRVGLLLLEYFVPDSEPLAGDLVEEFRRRPSRAWFWWQVIAALSMTHVTASDEIRPLQLVDLPPCDVLERSRQRNLRFRPVNLTASPLQGVGGLGLVALLLLMTVVVPAVWWVMLASTLGGLALGIILVVKNRKELPGLLLLLMIPLMTLSAPAEVDGRQRPPRPAVPLEPIGAILDAFRAHAVVALGTGSHNNQQGFAFLRSLVRDPRFPFVVNDIVVECGNARFQGVMDRFVAGEDVASDSLRRAWQDTTQAHAVCDVPIHEQLFRTVRSVNASLPRDDRIRVLLGDSPIDWTSPRRREEREKYMEMRDSYPAGVIEREVLAKGRRALIVYGQMHLQRKQLLANYDMSHPLAETIVSLLERSGRVNVFSVWGNSHVDMDSLQPDIRSWPTPSLAMLKGTVLGAENFMFFYPLAASRFRVRKGKLEPIPREQWRDLRMEDQFDAVLYLGPQSEFTRSRLSPALCADPAYMKMRLERIAEAGPQSEADRLREYCASVAHQ